MSATEAEEPESDQAYFRAVEEIFIGLRGAPLLLSPADWKVAQRWHREGVPLDLVRRSLEEQFAKRKERGAKGRVSSLRYCAPGVEAAWAELRELAAGGERSAARPFLARPRLAALASALPADWPGREEIAARLAGLAAGSDDPQRAEEELARLDGEMLAAARAGLTGEREREIAASVEASLARLRTRLPAAEVEEARQRLAGQILRRSLGLPVLSLFSPEAEPAAD